MEDDSQEIYKTHSNEQLVTTEPQSRILNNKTVWKIAYNEDWEKLLYKIKESDVKILQITTFANSAMFKCISSIRFSSLIELNLSKVDLVTTEPILMLHSPQIQYIRLNGNKLTNIKSLRKANYPFLKELLLHDNYIIDCSPLVELHGNEKLKIQLANSFKHPMTFHRTIYETNPIENYNVLFKLSPNSQLIVKPVLTCINQKILDPMFKQKYKK